MTTKKPIVCLVPTNTGKFLLHKQIVKIIPYFILIAFF